MLTGICCNGFTITDQVSNMDSSIPTEVSVRAEKDNQQHNFTFIIGPKMLVSDLQTDILAGIAGKNRPDQQSIVESYVYKAFEQITGSLTTEQDEQARSDTGYTVSFIEELVPLPASNT